MRRAGDEPLPGQSLMTLAVWPRSVFVVPMYYTTWMSATPKTKIFLLRSYAAPSRAQLRCSASASPSARRHSPHTYTCGAGARAWWGSGRAGGATARPGAQPRSLPRGRAGAPTGAGEHVCPRASAGALGHATGLRAGAWRPVRSGGWARERSCAPTRYSGLSVTHTALAGEMPDSAHSSGCGPAFRS